MAADWLEDLADLFEQQGLGTKASTTAGVFGIFTDGRPAAKQHTLIILMRTGGTPDAEIAELRLRTFQVLVVGDRSDPSVAEQKAEAIYDTIANKSLTATAARTFKFFVPIQFPTNIGPDENGNFQYSHNYRTLVKEEVN